MGASRALIREVRRALQMRADPEQAPRMQAYMKSDMPYLGVKTPALREACRAAFDAHPLLDFARWLDTASALWRGAHHREERYAAIELTGHRAYDDFQRMKALPLYER